MMDDLQEKCNVLLDDESVLEEDKIEKVEELVQGAYPDLSSNDLERMVLDILWRHRDSGSRERLNQQQLNNARIVERKPAAIVKAAEAPLPSDYTKLEPKRLPVSQKQNQEKDISWEDWGEQEENAMAPFDILRQVLGEENTDEDIERALEKNNYDIQATLGLLMKSPQADARELADTSISSTSPPPEKTICKYFLQYQECLRADCKYSHDLSSRICRFWLQGSCLAGSSCAFLHYIPEPMVEKLTLTETPSPPQPPPKLTEEDFPSLGNIKNKQGSSKKASRPPSSSSSSSFVFNPAKSFVPGTTPAASPPVLQPKPVVASPKPAPAPVFVPPKRLNRKVVTISYPKLVPWVATDYEANQKYVSHRHAASRHAEMRNKYLQLAAGSWHQNNAAQARLLSTKGQKHNDKMIDEYFAGADLLFEQRKKPGSEIYVDLHGMELEESIEKLEEALLQIESEEKDSPRPVYAICGIGHHYVRKSSTENKLSIRVKQYLDKWGYEYDEFKTKDDRYGRIIGIDPWSHI
ncbi:hypothetical protein TRICI_005604 [Trichomonascus ciferrii]|uniref:Uncharacterized protein n=1 Tax=Trichomonascus ciferrii TaxID=44093 RepID=A0A642UTG0_9ASCO|nr:hypothetical protein TRICI_005604 [Trichomonascus ciferrii]